MIRPALARVGSRWVWRSPLRAARLLESFELAEASSMLDMLAAARSTPSPERRALYLRHALDEDRHAHAFSARARELRKTAAAPAAIARAADFDGLFDRLGELDFVAFVHHAETRGHAQFVAHKELLEARGDTRGASLFAGILEDEERHARYSGALLRELAGSERVAQRALRRVALRELLWRWRRAGGTIASLLFTVTSVALYVVLAPLALVYRAFARARLGWLPPETR